MAKNPELAKLAAASPDREGASCKAEPGAWVPAVDFNRCEGRAACAEVCPYDVFELRRIDDADWATLGWVSRIKLRLHGMQVAYTPNASACRACGLCGAACPERAIRLVPGPGEQTGPSRLP